MITTESQCFTEQIETLPPLRTIVHRILTVTAAARSSAKDVARVLCEDQAVAAKILRVANSPFYGACRKITEVSRAVVILGTTAVKNLVLGLCARDALANNSVPSEEHTLLWQHSIAVASACEMIARRKNFNPPEEYFVAGLLHDVGRLAMAIYQGELLVTLVDAAARKGDALALERECFRIDHAVAGQRMLSRWGLPESFCQVAGRHHALKLSDRDPCAPQIATVILGDAMAEITGYGIDLPTVLAPRITLASQILGLSTQDLTFLFANLRARVEQAVVMLDDQKRTPVPLVDAAVARRAWWITSSPKPYDSLNQALLHQNAYEVVHASLMDPVPEVSPGDVVFIGPQSAELHETEDLALRCMAAGIDRTYILTDPPEGQPVRRRTQYTGIAYLPSLLSVFDLKWVECG